MGDRESRPDKGATRASFSQLYFSGIFKLENIRMKKICGIYQIRNLVNWKVYIGSSKDILYRWAHHKSNLRHNHHDNPHLQSSWNKNGEEDFVFEIVEKTSLSNLLCLEQRYLDNVIRWGFDYNICRKANVPPDLTGRPRPQDERDRISKAQQGELRPNSVLTESDVFDIFEKYASGNSSQHLGEFYNVGSRHISSILRGDTWSHIYEIVSDSTKRRVLEASATNLSKGSEACRGTNCPTSKLTDDNVLEIRELSEDYNQRELGEMFNVSRSLIGMILRRERWSHI